MVFGWVTFVHCHTGFIAIVRRRPTGFMDRQNYLNKTMVETNRQNCYHSWSICPVHGPSMKLLTVK